MGKFGNKLSRISELVVDLFSCTFPNAKACLDVPWHRRITGYKLDAEHLAPSMDALVETCARQIEI